VGLPSKQNPKQLCRPCRLGVLWAATLLALAAPASQATAGPVGSLAQLSGTAGCNQNTGGADGCATTTGLNEANGVAVSPDGKNAYAASDSSNSVVEFSRDPATGALTQLAAPNDCIAQGGTECGTTTGRGLFEATGVTVSPDGKNVYVASTGSPGEGDAEIGGPCSNPNCAGAVAVFSRDPGTGVLTQLSAAAGCVSEKASLNGNNEPTCTSGTGLGDANSVAVSPQGDHVYVSSGDSNAVAEFKRDSGTGALTQLAPPNDCFGETGGAQCGTNTGHGLNEAFSVTVSPDGASVYVASQGASTGVPQTDGSVAALHRDPATGALTQLTGGNACLDESGADSCTTGRGLASASSVVVSRDGKNVYVAGSDSDALAAFSRDVGTGALTQLSGTAGCLQKSGGGDGCATATGLAGVFAVAVAPDGASVYAGSSDDHAVSEFSRDPASGALTQLASPDDCIAQGGSICGTTTGRGTSGTHGLAVSPDGETVYSAAIGAVATFERADPPPSCSGVAQTLVSGATAGISLMCSDPLARPLTRSIVTGPAHGTLGGVDQSLGAVSYTAAGGFVGADSFTFQASDGSEASAPATAALTVMAVPGPLPGAPRCMLSAAQATTVSTARAHSARRRRVAPKSINLGVLCDQDTSVALTGAVSATGKKVRLVTQAKKRRRRTRRFTLAPLSATAHANVALKLTEKLPGALRRLLKRGARASASFNLSASNSNGTSTATTTIARLRLVKKRRHR
jgi:DNA-binding beta-propeller fold protein YncE